MDTEQQIRLNFLEEAEEYLDRMESHLLGIATVEVDAQKVDTVLRAAHSIKGGAAMMGFDVLSKVAHRLEDFLKILRVRYAGQQIATEIETRLLQSVDILRGISDRNRQGLTVDESAIGERTQLIFAFLQEHLGDLEAADENALLAQNEDNDPALLLFEEGVDEILDRFEGRKEALDLNELATELSSTALELTGFGQMAGLNSFVELCESIEHQAEILGQFELTDLYDDALKAWRRSHALVLRGKVDKLPTHLEGYASANSNSTQIVRNLELEEQSAVDGFELPADEIDLTVLQSAFDVNEETDFDPLDTESLDLTALQSTFDVNEEADFDPLDTESLDLTALQSTFDANEEVDFDPLDTESLDLTALQSTFDANEETDFNSLPLDADTSEFTALQPVLEGDAEKSLATVTSKAELSLAPQKANSTVEAKKVEKMVRVPTSQLQQFNSLFEQLVLNRNSIDLRLQQLQNVVGLMNQRMAQMERSNVQLKQWYDRASVEGLLNTNEQSATNSVNLGQKPNRFDTLEMDRYSDIHLICQEQIETIVQLQEVATDIELGIRDVNQSARDLRYTTKSMQGNVTRTQMLPFGDAVKRLPRVIRDLNIQFAKQVELKITGEQNLLDRSVIEALSDPLMHLLRNSFDHGIEEAQTRLALNKPESGTITIQASNQGTYSIITLSDDGSGIDLDKIRDRVYQMGLSKSEVAQISEAELLNFIFEPGFSTAQAVTELSGRGVGMDIVKTSLSEIRGDVNVDTYPGKGTTFTLKIPFTLSILRVAIVEQNGIIFAIPADSVKELIPFEPEQIMTVDHREYINWNQTPIPLIKAANILVYRRAKTALNLTGEPNINRAMTLMVGDESLSAAIKIDRFWNEQESTIRSIESPVSLHPAIVSSVVFGDGKVIPLIDPLILVTENVSAAGLPAEPELTNQDVSALKTVLVVDDSINVRRYLSLTLEKAGYLVEQATDGRNAVDKLLGGLQVQAVICDLEMPRLDGYGVLEEIKERSQFDELPIAMLTSRSNEKHRKLAMNLGASAYFAKPYNEKELLNKLSELIDV